MDINLIKEIIVSFDHALYFKNIPSGSGSFTPGRSDSFTGTGQR
jgi:hypothetical protein